MMKNLKKLIIPGLAIALIVSFYFDQSILIIVNGFRNDLLNNFMLFITKDGLVIFISVIAFYLIYRKKYVELALLIITTVVSLESAFLLKKIFQVPRPFSTPEFEQMALKLTTGYSFPSMHAAFCLAVIPFLKIIFESRVLRYIFATIFFTITFSRVYIGLHYTSDILAGGILGYSSSVLWLWLDEKKHIGSRLVRQFLSNLELRRQIAHALLGIALIFLIHIGIVTAEILAAVLIIGTVTIILIKNYRLPVISRVLEFFEREKDLRLFPGKGPFFFILGSLLALLFFERTIALAAIAIMAIGDAVATIAGHYFGRYKNPFNSIKHLEGTVLAIIFSTIAAYTFVPFHLAFVGGLLGIIFESFTIKFVDRVVDDNLMIPLVAGIAMTALM